MKVEGQDRFMTLWTLLIAMSSVLHVVGALQWASYWHLGFSGYVATVAVGLAMAACNLVGLLWLQGKMVGRLERRPGRMSNWLAGAFCIFVLLWTPLVFFGWLWLFPPHAPPSARH